MRDYYTALPVWDYWRVVDDLPGMQSGQWGFLWHQHNEHRIVFPELIFAVDSLYFHGRQIVPLAASFLFYVGTWVVLGSAVLSDRAAVLPARVALVLLAGSMVLFRTVALVLAVPFLLQWTLMQFAVAGALYCVSRMRRPQNGRWFWGVAGCCAVAVFSSGNGLVLWPVVLACAVAIGLTRAQLLRLSVAAAVTIGTFFIGYRSTSSLNIRNLLTHPAEVIAFVASYLSMPFGGLGAVEGRSGLIAGFLVLGAVGVCVFLCFRKRWLREHPPVVLMSFIAVDILTALLTAGGRMNPADPAYAAAKAWRYLSVPQMNWGAAILLLLWVCARLNVTRVFVPVFTACAVALMIYLPKLKPWTDLAAEPFYEAELAAMSFENNVPDPQLGFDRIYPDLRVLNILRERLQKANLSIYYHGRGNWIGRTAPEFASRHAALPGAVLSSYPTADGIQVVGWVDDTTLRKPVSRVLLVDAHDKILGFAQRFTGGFPDSAAVPGLPVSLGWAGFVSSEARGQQIFAYAIDPRKTGLMPLDLGLRLGNLLSMTKERAGGVLPAVTWTRKLQTEADSFPGAVSVTAPLPVDAHSTYGGGDANTGSVTATFSRPASGCIMIPVMSGPSVVGLTAKLEDAKSGELVETFPLRNLRSNWNYWQVQIAPAHAQLRLVLEDNGNGWGQWVGAASPLSCR